MDVDRLRALVAVVDHGGFSAAARAVGKTQPAISQAVARLEEELDQALLVRSPRQVSLTEAGRILVDHAREALATLRSAQEQLRALGNLELGALAVGCSDTNAYYVLPPVLREFRKRHGGVELQIENRPSPTIAKAVLERRLDLGLVVLPLPPSLQHRGRPGIDQLSVSTLMAHEDVVVCAPDHPLADRCQTSLEEVASHPLVLLDRATGARAWFDQLLAARGLRPRVAMEMGSLELVKRLVELNFGLSIVPRLAIQQEVAQGRLVALNLEPSPGGRRLALITPGAGPLSAAATAFRTLAQEMLAISDPLA